MPTTSRPDLLPFARQRLLGLPYHGKVEAGTLTLPSSATMSYTQPSDGGCVMVQHPLHAATNRTSAEAAFDTAHDYQWQEYALLSGYKHQIGGHELGEEIHLYCDAEHAWRIRIKLTAGTGSCKVEVFLVGLFGVFSDTDYSMTETLLATHTWSPTNENGNTMPTALLGGYAVRSFSKTGDKAVLNVGTTYSSAIQHAGLMRLSTQHQAVSDIYVHDIVRIAITGVGSLAAGEIGDGIAATIDQGTVFPWYEFSSTFLGTFPSDPYGSTDTRTYNLLTVVNPDGTESVFTRTLVENVTTSSLIFDEFLTFVGASTAASTVDTFSFGGAEITSSTNYSGTFDYYASPDNSGTLAINGNEEAWQGDGSGNPMTPVMTDYRAWYDRKLPHAVYAGRPSAPSAVLFSDGTTEATTTGVESHNFAYDPGSGAFATATGTVSFV